MERNKRTTRLGHPIYPKVSARSRARHGGRKGWLWGLVLLAVLSPVLGEEPPAPSASATVQKILDEAEQRMKTKQPQGALQAADRALRAAREGKDLVGEAQAHRSRARALQELRRTEAAVAAWREAAAAWERVGDGPGRVEALATAGFLLWGGQRTKADVLLAQALQLGRAESKRPLAAATMLFKIGVSNARHGQLGPARQLFEASLILRERLAPNSLGVAASLNNLGFVARQQGNLAAADEYFHRALAIQEKLAPNSLGIAASLGNLGVIAKEQRDLAAAADYFRRALIIQEQQAPNSRDTAESLTHLGNIASQQGDLAAAADYHRRALAIREQQAPNSLDVAGSLNNLGVVALKQGDQAAAADYFRRALAIKEQQAPNSLDMARSLSNWGAVASKQGDQAAAADYFRRALAIMEQQAPNSLDVAGSLDNLGVVAEQQGDLAAAADYFRRALAIKEQQAPNSLDVARSLDNLGVVAHRQGDQAAAADYHQRALVIREQQAPNSLDMARSLGHLGLVTEQQRNRIEAERLAHQAWTLVRQQAAAVSGDEARQAFGISTAFYAAHLLRYQLALGETGPAFTTLEEGRAQALQQLLLERAAITEAVDGTLWSAYQRAVAARDRAEAALSQASGREARARRAVMAQQEQHAAASLIAKAQEALTTPTQQLDKAQSAYTQARLKADQLWADLKASAPRAFVSPLTLEQAQQALPIGTLLMAFVVGDEQTHLFLLRTGDGRAPALTAHTLAIPRKALQEAVQQLRRQITDPAQQGAGPGRSRQVFARLFPPEVQKAVRRARRLLISPDGPLWDLPFAALVINKAGPPQYLGQDQPLTYTRSLALFAQSRHDPPQLPKGSTPSVVVVGNPRFDRKTATRITAASQGPLSRGERSYLCFGEDKPAPPLPNTALEATQVAHLYQTEPLLGEQATEATLRERIGTADIIHLATHGCPHPTRAMSAGILLTPPEQEPAIGETSNDGVLQAWEIHSQLKLRAELVVLSTCESGQGEIKPGEGLVGLTRALQYAGARSIVASQWAVDDQSTAALMVAFHRRLRQGLAKDEALRRAMAQIRQQPRTAAPYYWAAFYLMGDPDNPNLGGSSGP